MLHMCSLLSLPLPVWFHFGHLVLFIKLCMVTSTIIVISINIYHLLLEIVFFSLTLINNKTNTMIKTTSKNVIIAA